MVDAALEAAQHSLTVVGLEQGDRSYAAAPERKCTYSGRTRTE
ncbi:hypothetical protein AZE42_09912 [Rhizopogon vesiculosus]|uniref:Uncharacterized protein n=1 Tax=Rhizopogon vesiculosus TaxID=180088 RepID=A0A1J8QF94_9AGAM|nr:hypothetical protein AZE42_09912 [Rhizopogon vesiculosus]